MAFTYDDWKGRPWTVIESTDVAHIAPGNRLEFTEVGSTRSVTNKTSNCVWSTGFPYNSTNDKVGDSPLLSAVDGFKYTITRTGVSPNGRLECEGSSGGGSWVAQEGG